MFGAVDGLFLVGVARFEAAPPLLPVIYCDSRVVWLPCLQSLAATIPPALKPIVPYLQRADELERSGNEAMRLVANYCRSYAVRRCVFMSFSSRVARCGGLDEPLPWLNTADFPGARSVRVLVW